MLIFTSLIFTTCDYSDYLYNLIDNLIRKTDNELYPLLEYNISDKDTIEKTLRLLKTAYIISNDEYLSKLALNIHIADLKDAKIFCIPLLVADLANKINHLKIFIAQNN